MRLFGRKKQRKIAVLERKIAKQHTNHNRSNTNLIVIFLSNTPESTRNERCITHKKLENKSDLEKIS